MRHLPDNLQMLRDLYEIFTNGPRFISTTRLVEELADKNPDYWSESSFYGKKLTPQRMGRILYTSYGLLTTRVGDSCRGYHAHQFSGIWFKLSQTELLQVGGKK